MLDKTKKRLLAIVGGIFVYVGIWVMAWFLGEHKPTYWEFFPQLITAWFPFWIGVGLIIYATWEY